MSKKNEQIPDIDDVVNEEPPIDPNELLAMTEDDWVSLKNGLQEFLFRSEQTEHPAFTDVLFIDWIREHSDQFDRFYQGMRKDSPEQLLRWHKTIQDNTEKGSAQFILAWSQAKQRSALSR